MAEAAETKTLQIDEDLDHQRRSWAMQRVGWGVMAAIIVAAGLGLFGTGMLSRASLGGERGPLRVEYQRFGRWLAPLEMKLEVHGSPAGTAEVWVSAKYLECFTIEAITPEPEGAVVSEDRVTYRFRVEPGETGEVTFHLVPEKFGVRQGRLGLPGEAPLAFRQVIYP